MLYHVALGTMWFFSDYNIINGKEVNISSLKHYSLVFQTFFIKVERIVVSVLNLTVDISYKWDNSSRLNY